VVYSNYEYGLRGPTEDIIVWPCLQYRKCIGSLLFGRRDEAVRNTTHHNTCSRMYVKYTRWEETFWSWITGCTSPMATDKCRPTHYKEQSNSSITPTVALQWILSADTYRLRITASLASWPRCDAIVRQRFFALPYLLSVTKRTDLIDNVGSSLICSHQGLGSDIKGGTHS
jgi:hypothetical protein